MNAVSDYLGWLETWEIPEQLRDPENRYGLVSYQNQEVLDSLTELSNETQLLELIIGLLVGKIALLHPAFFTARRAHPNEPLRLHSLQYLHALTIADYSSLAIDGGYAVAKNSFGSSNISIFAFFASSAASSHCGEDNGETEKNEDNRKARRS